MEELEFQRLVLGDRVFVKCPDDVWRAGRIASPHVEQKAGAGPVRHVCVIEGDGRYDGRYARHAMRFGAAS